MSPDSYDRLKTSLPLSSDCRWFGWISAQFSLPDILGLGKRGESKPGSSFGSLLMFGSVRGL